jgi:hypothetical protein
VYWFTILTSLRDSWDVCVTGASALFSFRWARVINRHDSHGYNPTITVSHCLSSNLIYAMSCTSSYPELNYGSGSKWIKSLTRQRLNNFHGGHFSDVNLSSVLFSHRLDGPDFVKLKVYVILSCIGFVLCKRVSSKMECARTLKTPLWRSNETKVQNREEG